MKNILIPTIYESDTNDALRIALDINRNSAKEIILLSISEISDSIMDLLFISSAETVDLKKREEVLQFWEQHKAAQQVSAGLKIHHQYGLSKPLVNRLLERFDASMIIVPQSFKKSKHYIHQFSLRLFHQSGCAMLLLPAEGISNKGIQRALYLDDTQVASSQAVQQYSFHVIHKSMIKEQESVRSIVAQMKIDLIVKQKRREAEINQYDNEALELGLPVLAI